MGYTGLVVNDAYVYDDTNRLTNARKHIISDLALFFSWIDKPPSETSPMDIDL
jgi:hypothetical protein